MGVWGALLGPGGTGGGGACVTPGNRGGDLVLRGDEFGVLRGDD